MKLSVCTVCFQKQSPMEYLPNLAPTGFKYLDLYHRQLPISSTAEERKRIVDFISASGFEIVSLCSGFGHNYLDPDEAIRLKRLEEDKIGIDLAADSGAKVARVFLGTTEREEVVFKTGVPLLKELVAYAESRGIVLAMENHRGYYSGTPEGALRLCAEINSPSLGILYEPGNLLGEGYDFKREFYFQAPYIVHMHLKDGFPRYYDDKYGKGYRLHSTLLGEGRLDVPWIFEHLQEINYQGCVSYEYESWHSEYNLPPIPEGLKQAFEYLQNI